MQPRADAWYCESKPADVRASASPTIARRGRLGRVPLPLAPAIVWQDRRTASVCDRLREAGHEDRVREVTGLVLDPYFTATKLAWVMENVEGAANAAVGTVDSWLVARLSAGRDHVTDASNASRTLLFDIGLGTWSEEMAELFSVPVANLPRVGSAGELARTDPDASEARRPDHGIAVNSMRHSRQGSRCRHGPEHVWHGSFVLMQTGATRRVRSVMLTPVAWRRQDSSARARGRDLHHRRAPMAARRLGIIGTPPRRDRSPPSQTARRVHGAGLCRPRARIGS